MRPRLLVLLAVTLVLAAGLAPRAEAAAPGPGAAESPRLVLLVSIDQFRYDYLARFGAGFTAAFRQLLDGGAVYTNAHLGHYPSVTAVGHSAMLTGAPPSISGIIGNDWYDRAEKRNVTSVEDPATRVVGSRDGADAVGSSPHRLLVSTVADELKMAHPETRVVSVSLKDRAAIQMVGRSADLALWWNTTTGDFVTSTWYAKALPGWTASFNSKNPADAWVGQTWRELREDGAEGEVLATLPATVGPPYYAAVYSSPFGNELLVSLAVAALEGEQLGQRGATDLLAVSFSCNDAVGHAVGPYSPKVRDISRRTDLALGRLLDAVDRTVGLGRTVVVVTADHGVAPVPEELLALKMPGGRLTRDALVEAGRNALVDAYGPGDWIEGRAGSSLYLDRSLINEKGLDLATVERTAADGVETLPSVWRAYTRSQILEGRVPPDPWSRRVMLSFNRVRSGDVDVLLDPYWMSADAGTTHGTPYSYDTHIPLVLMGPGIRPGWYDRSVLLNDLAPTLATLLRVETPSGSIGHVLQEALGR
jgi:predicted AlkP superfamily pyrophosphatase or phosphodiesterase